MDTKTGEHLVPIKIVAETLGLSVKTIERRIKAGILPAPERNGIKRVYRASKIPALIDAVTRGSR